MIWLWCTRVVWALLPITMGSALTDATDSWSSAPARTAELILWALWAVGLFGLFAPRPWALTLLRIVAPCAFVVAVLSVTSTSAASAVLALAGSGFAAAFALSAPVAAASANALAYGDEQRFTLRVPLPLLLGPIPIAVLVAALGATAGPLLLADGRIVVGIFATLVGVPLAVLVVRSLHPLSCRWFVLVPAGIAIADPLTLTEPVLVPRDHIASARRTTSAALGEGALDLRLGTLAGGIGLDLSEPVEFGRRRGRGNSEIVEPNRVTVAVVRADAALAQARTRRIKVA
ncbi:MAG: hypothetical protein QOE62_166 [Actinomycetota bacterium]|nr:hypothetical protein [Actinomycetota bacterium]